ncbi:MAG: hypothetical protein Tsb0018_02420 [Opitutales bacterium]
MYLFIARSFVVVSFCVLSLVASAKVVQLDDDLLAATAEFGHEDSLDITDSDEAVETVDRLPEWLYFFTRANGINYGILLTQLAILQKELGGFDHVKEAKVLTLLSSFIYGFGKMADLAITDQATNENGDPSLASVITSMRLGTYSLSSVQLTLPSWGEAIDSMDGAKEKLDGIPGAMQMMATLNSIAGVPIAGYDLYNKVDALSQLELSEAPTEEELAAYEKAWGGVYAYGLKMMDSLVGLGVQVMLFAYPIENAAYNQGTKWTLWALKLGGSIAFLHYEQGQP